MITNKEILEMIKNKQIPYYYPKDFYTRFGYYGNFNIEEEMDGFKRRDVVIENMGFILISQDWIDTLSEILKGKNCLEIMCGTGALTKCLKDKGVNIKATDNFSWGGVSNWNKDKNYWTKIENIDCIDAIEKYGIDLDYIIMSWAYMDDTGYRALLKMREVNPNCKMIYIGESDGGCTADDNFFNEINIIQNEKINEINQLYKSWEGIYDRFMLIN